MLAPTLYGTLNLQVINGSPGEYDTSYGFTAFFHTIERPNKLVVRTFHKWVAWRWHDLENTQLGIECRNQPGHHLVGCLAFLRTVAASASFASKRPCSLFALFLALFIPEPHATTSQPVGNASVVLTWLQSNICNTADRMLAPQQHPPTPFTATLATATSSRNPHHAVTRTHNAWPPRTWWSCRHRPPSPPCRFNLTRSAPHNHARPRFVASLPIVY